MLPKTVLTHEDLLSSKQYWLVTMLASMTDRTSSDEKGPAMVMWLCSSLLSGCLHHQLHDHHLQRKQQLSNLTCMYPWQGTGTCWSSCMDALVRMDCC